MSEQAPNTDFDNQKSKAAQNNVEHEHSVLAETLEEFNPQVNSGTEETIESDIDIHAFKTRIAELENEVKQAKEQTARANAETYNAQKRIEHEADKSKKFALQKFARELLEVVDNLERAIENADANDPVAEGVTLTHKALLTILNKNGVTVVDPQGEAFDADFHEAVGIDPEADANTVGTVLQKGYSLNGRLLRPAMVRVGQ